MVPCILQQAVSLLTGMSSGDFSPKQGKKRSVQEEEKHLLREIVMYTQKLGRRSWRLLVLKGMWKYASDTFELLRISLFLPGPFSPADLLSHLFFPTVWCFHREAAVLPVEWGGRCWGSPLSPSLFTFIIPVRESGGALGLNDALRCFALPFC